MSQIQVYINRVPYVLTSGLTILQACQKIGLDVPHFCYHDKLPVAGNCRMCLVEVVGSLKLVASCAVAITPGIQILTNGLRVKKSREAVLEFLLANHPLDCPICDQGGECDLQDITMVFGSDRGRFYEIEKRSVLDKDFGPLVKTVMNRCIHCTRCVRFADNLLGSSFLGTTGRGVFTEIGTYISRGLDEELFANIIDLCPVGALTSKPSAFTSRSWELVSVESIDIMDSLGASVRLDVAFNKVLRILPRLNDKSNSIWITNKARYIYDSFNVQRILQPQVNIRNFLVSSHMQSLFLNVSWNYAFDVMVNKWLAHVKHKFYCGYFVDLMGGISMRNFFNNFGLQLSNGQFFNIDYSYNYLFNVNFVFIDKILSFCLILWSNIRLESPILLLRLRRSLNHFAATAYVFGFFDIHYLNNVYALGVTVRSYMQFIEGYNAILFKISSIKLDFFPFIIVGEALADNYVIHNSIFYLLNQFYKYGSGYIVYFKHSFKIEFWKNVCFLSNHASRIGAFMLNIYNNYANQYEYYIAETKKLNEFVFLFGVELNLYSFDFNDNSFIVYQGTHGDIGALAANLLLPATLYIEKDAIYCNMFGGVLNSKLAVLAPYNVSDERFMLLNLSEKLSRYNNGNIYIWGTRVFHQFLVNYNGMNNLNVYSINKTMELLLPSFVLNGHIQAWHGVMDNLNNVFVNSYMYFYFLFMDFSFNCDLVFKNKLHSYVLNPSIYNYYRNDVLSKFSKTMSLCFNKSIINGFSFFH